MTPVLRKRARLNIKYRKNGAPHDHVMALFLTLLKIRNDSL